MPRHGDNAYGDNFAEIYDKLYADRDDLAVVTEALASLAGGGPILEFGIGTGRLALPLAKRGLKTYGIDNSERMLAKLRAKPGADQIVAVLGDCVEDLVAKEGYFSMVLLAFSTLFQFLSQDAQVRCFRNAARHLRPNGAFVVESFVHDRSRWHSEQEVSTLAIAENRVTLRLALLDSAQQRINVQRVELTPAGITFLPYNIRFVYPSEMDLMARLAGFTVRSRWGNWTGARFTASSETYIAVYEKVSESPL